MTADRLATLQRRAAADPGDVHAQAAWLRARVQAGERGPVACSRCSGRGYQVWASGAPEPVTYEDCPDCNGTGLAPFRLSVELAAYCGHAAARGVLGWPLSDEWPRLGYPTHPARSHDGKTAGSTNDFGIWLRGLARWGDEVMVRAAVAAALVARRWHCSPGFSICCGGHCSRCSPVSQAISAAEAWLEDKTEAHRREWVRCAASAGAREIQGISWLPQPVRNFDAENISSAARVAGEQPVREAIQRALIAWALA